VYKIIIFIIFFLLALVYIFLNLGNFIDVTSKPKKADIIVSLGGDYSGCRLKKAVELYKQGLSKSDIFVYTGRDLLESKLSGYSSRKEYLLSQDIKEENIFHVNREMITNTMEEVLFIKQYMIYHNYKSVLIVSHPQHSRRISSLANVIAGYENEGLSLSVASCNPGWWDKNRYYLNDTSFKVTMHEMVKLLYNVVKYNPLLIKYTSYERKKKEQLWTDYIDEI